MCWAREAAVGVKGCCPEGHTSRSVSEERMDCAAAGWRGEPLRLQPGAGSVPRSLSTFRHLHVCGCMCSHAVGLFCPGSGPLTHFPVGVRVQKASPVPPQRHSRLASAFPARTRLRPFFSAGVGSVCVCLRSSFYLVTEWGCFCLGKGSFSAGAVPTSCVWCCCLLLTSCVPEWEEHLANTQSVSKQEQ